jgi:soluble lytic murein transglycosylase
MLLMREAGKTGPEIDTLSDLYSRASTDKDVEFRLYMLAVIYTESRFDSKAVSIADAHGLMQMTELAVIDAAKHCNLRPVRMDNLFDSYTNVQYGTCYLAKLLGETEGDWDRALVAYNGGYAQLQRYDRGVNIASETANYVLKVKKAVKFCLQK